MSEKHYCVMKVENDTKRSWLVDLLRIIAMLMVMLFHYTTQFSTLFFNPGYAIVFPQQCATFGVAVFLILMGFYSYGSICNEKQKPWIYLLKRAKRLLPTFWICLIISSIVINITHFSDITAKQFILNFFLVNRFVNVPFIDGAYWYMLIVVAFTLFVFIAKCMKRPTARTKLYALYVLAYIVCGFIDCYIRKLPTILSFALFDHINKCVAGLIIAYLWMNRSKLSISNKFGGGLTITILFAGEFLWAPPDKAAVEIAAVLTVLVVIVYGNKNLCRSRLSSVIGVIACESYFIYLIHQQIGYIVLKSTIDIGVNCNVAVILAFLTVAAITILHYGASRAFNNIFKKKQA